MNRGQRSPGMYAWPNPKSSPLPEYSIELRFVAPMASATEAIPVLCCVQPKIDIVIAMPAIIPLRGAGIIIWTIQSFIYVEQTWFSETRYSSTGDELFVG